MLEGATEQLEIITNVVLVNTTEGMTAEVGAGVAGTSEVAVLGALR